MGCPSGSPTRAAACTAQLGNGDILVADRAYLDFSFFDDLSSRGMFFVVRKKSNMLFNVVKRLQRQRKGSLRRHATQVLSDELVCPANKTTTAKYAANGGMLRRVTAFVEIRGEMKKIIFLTNNLEWSAGTIAELCGMTLLTQWDVTDCKK